MPILNQSYRVNPLDLNGRIAVGISLPFNGTAVFNQTYSTKDQAKFNLINLILTNKGERVENPDFGSSARKFVFEMATEETSDNLKELIVNAVSVFMPEITIKNIDTTLEADEHKLTLEIEYQLKVSGDKDKVTIRFE